MREYQAENKLLFNILYPTIEFCEPWKLSDMEYQESQEAGRHQNGKDDDKSSKADESEG